MFGGAFYMSSYRSLFSLFPRLRKTLLRATEKLYLPTKRFSLLHSPKTYSNNCPDRNKYSCIINPVLYSESVRCKIPLTWKS